MSQTIAHVQEQYPETAWRPKGHWRKLPRAIDGRTRIGRRARALIRLYCTRLGSDADDPILANAIQRTAQLVALCEDLTARSLRGQDIPPDDIVRMNRLCDLQLRRLKLDRHAPQPATSLGDILRQGRSSYDATVARSESA